MAKQTYTKGERKAQFLKTGVTLAKKNGIAKVSAAAVATEHKVTPPLVFHIFGSREKLQAAIKREAEKQGVVLAEPKAAPAPKRKRSVAEVKAIKDKAAGKRPAVAKKAPARKGSHAAAPAREATKKVSRSAKDGKFVNKATVAANPDTTVTQKVKVKKPKQPVTKYPTQPAPTVAMPAEPNNSL